MAPSHERNRPVNRVGGRALGVFPGQACEVDTRPNSPRSAKSRIMYNPKSTLFAMTFSTLMCSTAVHMIHWQHPVPSPAELLTRLLPLVRKRGGRLLPHRVLRNHQLAAYIKIAQPPNVAARLVNGPSFLENCLRLTMSCKERRVHSRREQSTSIFLGSR